MRAGAWAPSATPILFYLSVGLIALPYYRDTNPVLAAIAQHAIDEVLADHEQS